MFGKRKCQLWFGSIALAVSALIALPAEAATKRQTVVVKAGKKSSPSAKRLVRVRYVVPAVPSFGQQLGLHAADDPLDLRSAAVLVLDQDTNEVLLAKNQHAVLPIASITKLMTALVVADAEQSLDELLTITAEDCNWIETAFDSVIASSHKVPGAIWSLGKTLVDNAVRKSA